MTAVDGRSGQGGAGQRTRQFTGLDSAGRCLPGSNDFASLWASRIQRVSGRLGRRRAAEAAGVGGQGGPDAGQGRLG